VVSTNKSKTSTLKTSAGTTIVSLKVTLRGAKPPIWRRLLVPSTMTLGDLHLAIQAAMGWEDCHLHAFDIDGRRYDRGMQGLRGPHFLFDPLNRSGP
jgi:hypothetical protein